MPLAAGTRLGNYVIVGPLGKGGMGEVYRANDTKLDREVAIKVLPAAFAQHPDRLARFEREAKVLASLNHTNIAAIYAVEESSEGKALVMELVEGETLKGPVPVETALKYAAQIASALDAAHEKGIAHRDLKPANIMRTPDGTIKVLDFGLAAVTQLSHGDGEIGSNMVTLTMSPTQSGMILGTAPYMSPEQAAGKTVDRRTDIWAFGVVLWEMLTGKRLFDGETISHTLASVLKDEPDWEQVPAKLRRLLRSCLEKDVKQRLQAIGDWKLLLAEDAPAAPPAPQPWHRSWLSWCIAAFLLLALMPANILHFREQPPVAELTRFQIPLPPNENFPAPLAHQEVSPDGRKLAFLSQGSDGKLRLWIRSLDSLVARALPGIEIASEGLSFFWSSDSRFIAFLSSDNKLKKVDVSGGPAQSLCYASGLLGGSWSQDGEILFAEGAQNGVKRVSETGGTPIALTVVDPAKERGHLSPKFLPDGRHFLYYRDFPTMPESTGIYLGSIDVKPSQQSSKLLVLANRIPAYYVPSGNPGNGHLLFYRDGTVLAQAFNPGKLELSGDLVPVAEQVVEQGAFAFFSASNNGVLVYVGGNGDSGSKLQLTWFDRQGKNLGTVGEPGFFSTIDLSRDGKQAAVSLSDLPSVPKANLWLLDLARGGAPTRFTFDAYRDLAPVWSQDGGRIVFASYRDGVYNLYQKLTSGAKDEVALLKSDDPKVPSSWSVDGRFLLYALLPQKQKKRKAELWILPMDGRATPILFESAEFAEIEAQFSPDGRWIAYSSDELGHYEVYVREFSLGSDGKPEATARHQISNGGGAAPRWRDDGKELIYWSLDGRTIMSSDIATKPVFHASPGKPGAQLPARLLTGPIIGGQTAVVTADGKRVLAAIPVSQSGLPQFTVVLNWQAGLKK